MYGLDDASGKFWLKVKETLVSLGLKIMPGDETFYYLHEERKLQGVVLTHVDYFTISGNADFLEKVMKGISETLTVSKMKRDMLRLTGLDI